MTKIIKSKKPKRRIPVAPPGKRHKSVKYYNRILSKKEVKALTSLWNKLIKVRDYGN